VSKTSRIGQTRQTVNTSITTTRDLEARIAWSIAQKSGMYLQSWAAVAQRQTKAALCGHLRPFCCPARTKSWSSHQKGGFTVMELWAITHGSTWVSLSRDWQNDNAH